MSNTLTITDSNLYTSANATTPAYVNQTVSFWAKATTNSSASLTFTIYYDYYLPGSVVNPASPVSVNVTGNPGSIVTTFSYDHVGNLSGAAGTYFHAQCIVSDGVSTNYTLNRYVYVRENQPPFFSYELPPIILTEKGLPVDLSTQVTDLEGDSVDVTWEWGDGSTNATNVTGPSAAGVWCNQTHTWDPYVTPGTGDFYLYTTMNITLDDGFGNVVVGKYTIEIDVPRNHAPTISLAGPYAANLNSTVTFQANATDLEGDPLTWVFDFGDGSPIEVCHTAGAVNVTVWNNVTHVFDSVGSYEVLMNVSDVAVINPGFPHNTSVSLTIQIVENRPPGVSERIMVSDENPVINSTLGYALVVMTVEAADLDGDVLVAVWNFSDGSPDAMNTSSGGTSVFDFTQVHAFSVPGLYNVTANVTDGKGHWVTSFRIISVVSSNLPPELVLVDIEYPPWRGDYACPNEIINFTVVFQDPENDALTFVVDFGDGSMLLNVTLSDYVDGNVTLAYSHSYSEVGEYVMWINVTDNVLGLFDHSVSYSCKIGVEFPQPIAEAGVDQTVLVGQEVWLDGSASYSEVEIVNWTWDFIYEGTLVELYGEVVSFTFWTEGEYTVSLHVLDSNGQIDGDTMQVVVSGIIPEFPMVLTPIASVIGLVLLFRYHTGRKKH